jgi:hypothetical protein
VSAYDLTDHAPAAEGDGYQAWRERWSARHREAAWVGQPDHVCFPWSEPEATFIDPVTGDEELVWNVLPPELCLRHRHDAPRAAPCIVVDDGRVGPYRLAATVVSADVDDHIVVADVVRAETVVFDGAAAELWRALRRHGRDDAAAADVAARYGVDPTMVHADLHEFVHDMQGHGLLERSR